MLQSCSNVYLQHGDDGSLHYYEVKNVENDVIVIQYVELLHYFWTHVEFLLYVLRGRVLLLVIDLSRTLFGF